VFPAPLMTTITELGSFIATEKAAADLRLPAASISTSTQRSRPGGIGRRARRP